MSKKGIITKAVVIAAIATRICLLRFGYRSYASNLSVVLSPRPNDYTTELITVVEPGYCVIGNSGSSYVHMPSGLLFYEVGDQFLLETDGLLLTSDPMFFNKVYSYKLKGHVSGDEVKKLQNEVRTLHPIIFGDIYP